MPYDVFISYSHHDKAVADAICARLEQDGIRCWYAPRDIRPGEIWAESIINTIENVKVMIVVFTEDSNKSPQVLKEITNAVNAGVTIIPFKMTNDQPSKSLQYFFADVHWLDAVGAPLNKSIENLSQKVHSIIGGENAAPKAKQPQPQPVKKSRLGLILAAAAAVIVLVVLGLVLKDRLSGGTPAPTADPQTNTATSKTSAPHNPSIDTDNQVDAQAPATPVPTAVPTEVPTPVPTSVPTEVPTAVPTPVPTEVPTPVPTAVPTETPTLEPTATPEPTEAPTINPNNASYFYKPTGVAVISDGKQTFTAPVSSLYTLSKSEITHGMKFLFDTGSDLPEFSKIASMEMTPHEDGNEYHRYFHVTLTDGSVMEEDVETARSTLVFTTDQGKVTRQWYRIESIQFDHGGTCMVDWPEYAKLSLKDGNVIIVPAFTLNAGTKTRPSENTIGYDHMYDWVSTIKTLRGYEIDFNEIRSIVFGEGTFEKDRLSDIWAEGLKPGWIKNLPVELYFRDGRKLNTEISEDFLKFFALDEFGNVEVREDQISRIDFITDITE